MNYGYARCSTNEGKQDIDRQVRELKTAGADEVFLDYEHGDSKVKQNLDAMFAAAEAGDTVYTLVGRLNVSEFARVCDISRPTMYKYLGMVRGTQ